MIEVLYFLACHLCCMTKNLVWRLSMASFIDSCRVIYGPQTIEILLKLTNISIDKQEVNCIRSVFYYKHCINHHFFIHFLKMMDVYL